MSTPNPHPPTSPTPSGLENSSPSNSPHDRSNSTGAPSPSGNVHNTTHHPASATASPTDAPRPADTQIRSTDASADAGDDRDCASMSRHTGDSSVAIQSSPADAPRPTDIQSRSTDSSTAADGTPCSAASDPPKRSRRSTASSPAYSHLRLVAMPAPSAPLPAWARSPHSPDFHDPIESVDSSESSGPSRPVGSTPVAAISEHASNGSSVSSEPDSPIDPMATLADSDAWRPPPASMICIVRPRPGEPTRNPLSSLAARATPIAIAAGALVAATFPNHAATADPPPCPPFVEVHCDHGGSAGGGPPIGEPCTPGPGHWSPAMPESICLPETPIDQREQFTFGLTRWNRAVQARAHPNVVNCMVSLSGQSILLGGGSRSEAISASFQHRTGEFWQGAGPAAPRIVQLRATGFAGLSIAVTCGPSRGCTATASAAAAGGCSSLGDASATLEPKAIGGTASYDGASSTFEIEGDVGVLVDDSGPTMTGEISRDISWRLEGEGAASGSASYVVRPDRAYCAYTNRPIVRRSYAAIASAVAVTVEAGSASAVGIATAGFSVN